MWLGGRQIHLKSFEYRFESEDTSSSNQAKQSNKQMVLETKYLVFFKSIYFCCGLALTSILLFNPTICGLSVCVCVCYSCELSLSLAYEICELEGCSQNELPPGGFPKAQPALIT